MNKDIYEDEDRKAQQVIAQGQSEGLTSPCFSFILGSFSNYLMVYKDVQLMWTAKTSVAPVYVNTATFENKQGLIVTLADNGWLQVSYLGTDAPTS